MADKKKYFGTVKRALEKNGLYTRSLDPQIESLASAMRILDMANKEIDDLKVTYVWEETRYGQRMVPHPAFRIAKDQQLLITRQMKTLHLTVDDLSADESSDPLLELTSRLARRRDSPVILTPDPEEEE